MAESDTEERAAAEPPAPEPLPEDIAGALGDAILASAVQGRSIDLTVRPGAIVEVVRYLLGPEAGACRHLSSLAGVDHGDDLGVTYHLYQVGNPQRVVLHVRLPRTNPTLPSLADLLPAANWKERETMELFGIVFEGHPDPRPLLLPDDWDGYPLRKDYIYPVDHPYLRPDPLHELHADAVVE